MSAIILRHLDALAAQMSLVTAQIEALRHAVTTTEPVKAAREVVPKQPDRCTGIPDVQCALRNDEAAISRASFGNQHAWQCVGCKYEGGTT